jgi:hypothetical protein
LGNSGGNWVCGLFSEHLGWTNSRAVKITSFSTDVAIQPQADMNSEFGKGYCVLHTQEVLTVRHSPRISPAKTVWEFWTRPRLHPGASVE